MARPLAEVGLAELWRGELWEELEQLQLIQARIASVEEKLNAIGEADKRVQLLRTIPGVGPRLAEAIVALLDQPQRFP
jgi:transposase